MGQSRFDSEQGPHSGLAAAVDLTRRVFQASTPGEAWAEATGFLAVQLAASAVVALERQEGTRAVMVRAGYGEVSPPVGARLPLDCLPPFEPAVLSAESLPWPLPEPVHLAPVHCPAGTAPTGALLVGRPATDPGLAMSFATEVLGAATQRLRSSDRQIHLLAVVSHDLRNPLASLLLHAEALRAKLRRGEREGADESISNIQAAARQMDRLIGDLRDVEAARRGTLGIEPRACDFLGVLSETLDSWRPRAQSLEIELVWCARDVALPPLRLDPVRMRQVIDNLLSNALAATPTGGRVELSLEPCERELLVRVIDSGPGVPHEARDRIFESFERGDTTRYPGLGLGLSIARSIVDLHGGRLELEHSSPEGACFCVRLPLTRSPPA